AATSRQSRCSARAAGTRCNPALTSCSGDLGHNEGLSWVDRENGRSGASRFDRVEPPGSVDAFEFMVAPVFEVVSGAGGLDDPPAVLLDDRPGNRIMGLEKAVPFAVADLRRASGGTDDVSEQDRRQRAIRSVGRRPQRGKERLYLLQAFFVRLVDQRCVPAGEDHEPGAVDVTRDVAALLDRDEAVEALAVQHQRGNAHQTAAHPVYPSMPPPQ